MRQLHKILNARWLALFAAIAWISPAHAGCSLSASDLSFGRYDPSLPYATAGLASVIVDCTAATRLTIVLSSGQSSSGTRRMSHAFRNEGLSYNLFRDSTMTQVWGDGSFGGGEAINAKGRTTRFIYGLIYPRQDALVGNYSDSITVTILP